MVNHADVVAWIEALQNVYTENKEFLTELDSAIGDADHGINLNRGYTAVTKKVAESNPADIGSTLKTVAMTLISTVGGASGPLYGTFFLRASTASANKTELSADDIITIFDAGLQGVIQRGKANLGDKTMIDALTPALEAMKQAVNDGADISTMLQQGVSAAEQGMKDTIPMLAKKGRASYLGERSVGHQDPGATSSYLLLKTAAETWG